VVPILLPWVVHLCAYMPCSHGRGTSAHTRLLPCYQENIRKKRTSAQRASHRRYTVGLPSVYPIVHYSHPEERSNSAQNSRGTITLLKTRGERMPATHGNSPS